MNAVNPLRGTMIFVYGTEVNDFHALNKEYINTLNVCAVQELHRKIVLQQGEINELKEKVNVLINYIDMSKMTALEGEINELKVRYDFIINYINLSK
jgi:FtsZ-binding cell division protein ZapB